MASLMRSPPRRRRLAATALTSPRHRRRQQMHHQGAPLGHLGVGGAPPPRGPRERREAATALYELCKLPENRRRVVREGVAPMLAAFTAVGSARAVKCREGRQELCRIPGITSVLSGVAGSDNLTQSSRPWSSSSGFARRATNWHWRR
ncbi:hypothetical protein BAE44_0011541 [Dichanthelium oligosanthes]|uniref:Uncharacterized protein n=1 Tax=Dichanthelium oligosanthes TaxID=888268 RepID=A0A1E5VQP4_9POAL|nr:hypothetical protein BAE44_0011541 [Dichanthelium oligosanthes]